jgi:hypothetical protein
MRSPDGKLPTRERHSSSQKDVDSRTSAPIFDGEDF